MDVEMPIMNGLKTTIAIRRLEPESNHIPIIAMTANALKDDRERCLDAGMDYYISKPIRDEDIKTVLSKWVTTLSRRKAVDRRSAIDRRKSVEEKIDSTEIGVVVEENHSPSYKHLDMDIFGDILEMSDGDGEFIRKIVAKFDENANSCIEKLEIMLKSGEFTDKKTVVHTFKGMSAQIGAARLADLCYEMEVQFSKGAVEAYDEIIVNIHDEYNVATELIKIEVNKISGME
jgi:response regulator RpfG family c-di-GMP phosphodiesterase